MENRLATAAHDPGRKRREPKHERHDDGNQDREYAADHRRIIAAHEKRRRDRAATESPSILRPRATRCEQVRFWVVIPMRVYFGACQENAQESKILFG